MLLHIRRIRWWRRGEQHLNNRDFWLPHQRESLWRPSMSHLNCLESCKSYHKIREQLKRKEELTIYLNIGLSNCMTGPIIFPCSSTAFETTSQTEEYTRLIPRHSSFLTCKVRITSREVNLKAKRPPHKSKYIIFWGPLPLDFRGDGLQELLRPKDMRIWVHFLIAQYCPAMDVRKVIQYQPTNRKTHQIFPNPIDPFGIMICVPLSMSSSVRRWGRSVYRDKLNRNDE